MDLNQFHLRLNDKISRIKNNEDWQLMHEYTVGAIQELIQVAACCIKATRQKAAE